MSDIINVWIGSDHAGYDLKSEVISHLEESDLFKVFDVGPFDSCRVDYPEYGFAVVKGVVESLKCGEKSFGILICGTGIGMSLIANKHEKIRGALAHNVFTAEMSRKHNDANILCLGARVIGRDIALRMVDVFLSAGFEGGRHSNRLKMIDSYFTNEDS